MPVQETVSEPKPLAPGEKVMVALNRKKAEAKLRQHIQLHVARLGALAGAHRARSRCTATRR